jgi:zinc protease
MLAVQLYLGRNFEWDAQLDAKIQALTGEQVQAAMHRHIDPAKLTMVKAGDFAKAKASP